ncbi:TPA: carboxymuconolactone decarboxylase [Clostridium botulinum]|uniref:carboxymuconolactone decarboxylase n=1 Tax=Clostridium botulinum TaxID=1491 RepID=UPI000D0CA32F|nr:carboxymuconolactone decarboxylase [Clostridium botulinum]PSM03697.1 carboxymuconolactone decarboxylase [Clostridium botulinum]HDK7140021.1 carboxymuconolactone decarboxylase [Clostridium botulinum]HDK7143609.1 carboxymuconolactone decarboxylase [Clostridium botulinum]HDK7147255.1 carboxymuconolactone decarboxylase [Clostridium botulinum]HDK7149567.1 carboxymuconolactone decarboxylase [Clostridium botulinum]
MEINYGSIIALVINLVLIFLIIKIIFKAIQSLKCFINRNKEMDKKLDIIMSKLENKQNN